jgi:DNA-binding response OmpR family regulator
VSLTNDPPAEQTASPSILLVEEYDALAVAIGSALRKFAPAHDRRTVGSFAEAEAAADELRPELIVIDLDPPPPGLVPFLERIKAAHPTARLLAIGCGTSPEFAAARSGLGGIQFIEKPFELAEFGSAVRGLIGADLVDGAPSTSGRAADIDLIDLAAVECVSEKNAVLRVEAAGGRVGELHFSEGQLCHATAAGLTGSLALKEMLRWHHPHFAETDRPANAPRTIDMPWSALLSDAAHTLTPREDAVRKASAARKAPRPKTGKKIVVVDDTEQLLDFVEEILSSAHPDLQIVTAHTGAEGYRRSELMIPDLVLLDYSLPDINGDEVCRKLLANESTARVPIVMMSGHVPEMAATAAEYGNVVATIAKPFLSHDLVALVEGTLAAGPIPAPPAAKKQRPPAPPPATLPGNGNGKGRRRSRNGDAQAEATAPKPAPPPLPEPPQRQEPKPVAPATSSVTEPPAPTAEPAPSPAAPPPPAPTPSPPIPTPSIAPVAAPPPPPPARRSLPATVPQATSAVHASTVAAPPRRAAPISRPGPIASPTASVGLPNATTVLVGFTLRTIAVQLTPALRIGNIRARSASRTIVLNFPPEAPHSTGALQTGFDLEAVVLDANHQIRSVSLVPNRKPIESLQGTRRFAIDEVEITTTTSAVELTPTSSAVMSIQMAAAFQIQAVELAANFEVARLLLVSFSRRVRVSLGANGSAGGAIFETAEVHTDSSAQIAEIVLTPV